ncbi:MAG: hypothetical protein E6Q54_13080 [Mycolicibacter arupensis]|uniref:Uncharacterized protein n=5 Tax=Mycolicibacter arupensis TaxID=342002 RepID=A0A5C7Y0Q8_9MYCO|nr:MAG: hypothetical protein E6Q54_13080 [Mycolicibacter arupensis]
MTDLPPGKWSSFLVGAWWPSAPTEPGGGVQYWSDQSSAKEREAIELQAFTEGISARNSGQTTEDELMRLRTGYNRLANASEHCRSKSAASRSVTDAVDELRRKLTSIADRYNPKLDELVAKNTPEAMTEAIGLIAAANAEATERGSEANGKIIAATQQMFNELGIEGDAQRWLQDNGGKFGPPPSELPTSEELSRRAAGTDQLPFPLGAGSSENLAGPKSVEELLLPAGPTVGGPAPGRPPVDRPPGAGSPGEVGSPGTGGPTQASLFNPAGGEATSTGLRPGAGGGPGPATNTGLGPGAGGGPGPATNTGLGPTGSLPAGMPGGEAMGSGGPSPMASGMPGLGSPGGGMPGGSGGGMPPGLSSGGPTQALASGMPGGGPPGLGGPPTPSATGGSGLGGFGQASQLPPSPSVTPMAGGSLGSMAQLAGSSTEVGPASPAAGATPATPATAPVTAGPTSVPSGPISAGPMAPSGPLPGYGADLRPAAAAPAVPTPPAGPASPTPPAPPGGPTTPASGGPTVASPADRSAPGKPTPGVGGQSGASLAGSMGAGSTAGAGAGTAARRLAEHQDLQRKVAAVARQAPNLAWAVGLRDDETTTVLATDLAGGWIPPAVKLPPGLTLLKPAHRRREMSAVDLLGAVIAAAAHQPNTYVTEAGPNDPIPGSGERARYGQHVDELGPTLIDVTGTNDRLPRIVQTVARAVARRSGVADNEVELFRQVVADTQARVLSAYPQHAPRDVADWMLLAAIDALIDGSEELARYHLAWYLAVQHGGVSP